MRERNMKSKAASARLMGAAARFIDSRLAAGRVAFSLADLVEETGLSDTAAKQQLMRQRERVARPAEKHSFFLIVSPEHRSMGAPPVAWWLDDYFKWLGHPYYLALQSAAGTYGSNPQAIQVTQVMTDSPRREITVGRLQVKVFVKRGIERTPTQPLAKAYAPLRVSTPEATVFDLVTYAPRIGGIERAVETISPLIPLMRGAELKKVLQTEDRTASAQRLGYILEKAGNSTLAEIVHAWLPRHIPVALLAVSAPGNGKDVIVPRWRILDNSRAAQP
jgi:hypothetical protein